MADQKPTAEALKERIRESIRVHIGGDSEMIDGIITDMFLAVADTVDNLEVEIPIEHWMGTKRHLSAETGRAIARWFREARVS